MGDEDITTEELLSEVAAYVLEQLPRRPGADWYTTVELWDAAREQGTNLEYDKFHDLMQRLCRAGKFERQKNGQNIYYRKVG